MHWSNAFVALVAISSPAFAHWNYESVLLNGKDTGIYEYVRSTKNSNSPVQDVSSKDMVCNVGGNDADVMAKTKTLSVKAGDQIGFRLNPNFGHPGVQQVYMSKAPSTAATYKGDGDWFKVYSLTTSSLNPLDWAPFKNSVGITNFTFTIPANIPSGQYLMRAEGVGLHAASTAGGAQFYIGCAQLDVTGGSSSGTPGPTIKFPGSYSAKDPGILVNIYYPPLTSYSAAGPSTWPNKCEDHTPNFVGQTSDGDCTPMVK